MSLEQVKALAQKDRKGQKGKKFRYSAETKEAAIEAVKSGESIKAVQRASAVSYPTVLSWTASARKKKRRKSTKRRTQARPTKIGNGKLIEVSPAVYTSLKNLGVEFIDVSEKEIVLRLLD